MSRRKESNQWPESSDGTRSDQKKESAFDRLLLTNMTWRQISKGMTNGQVGSPDSMLVSSQLQRFRVNFRIRLAGAQNKAHLFTVAHLSFPITDYSTVIQL